MIDPSTRLWIAVMNRLHLDSISKHPKLRRSAINYTYSAEFHYICSVIGLNTKKARNIIKGKK